ncbi:DEAD/DEAH box helicase family protein, partial [Myxococcota bacterium]|nr:DEAD/DEAH box helicase family protein [Myxococcota bacterium]
MWSYIRAAAMRPYGGQRVGEATAAFSPWPHQVSAFSRLYGKWPPRLLIADEVGLGKTIQAGMLLRQAVLSGRVRRVLILAPKAVLKQWQLELREKFNLYWPIYDGKHLTWCPCPAYPSGRTVEVDDERWHEEPFVIAGSQLVRLKPRARVLIEQAREWDLILLDEAHHARRKGAGGTTDKGPNALLRLMQKLAIKTQGLVLMTATPMQVHPKEVWDLMNLLGLPPSWDEASFLSFFEKLGKEDISFDKFDSCVQLFRDAERMYGETTDAEAATLSGLSKFKARKWVRLLRGESREPIRQIFSENRSAVVQLVQRSSPIRRLISRHTRDLLRRYFQEGKIRTPIAQRQVQDVFIDMKPEERYLYEEVEEYITSSYRVASTEEKQAVGFIMTIYRRRLASSFEALRQTLLRHRVNIDTEEDGPDEDAPDESMEGIDTDRIEKAAQKIQEQGEIDLLLTQLDRLPLDSKCERLLEVLHEVQAAGYEQVMIFTQYADTLDFLRKKLVTSGVGKILCFSGRGGEILDTDGSWKEVSRDETKRRFREGLADIMLCTDAAAEGLNFQFCGALINYDMPWNPMRVEQRIGRIDRLGQLKSRIRIVNLHYQDTVETDIYHVLRQRIRLFENFVGKLQPILSRLSGRITSAVLSGAGANPETR